MKLRIKQSVFIEWYVSEYEDYIHIAERLKNFGSVSIKDLFNDCMYFPLRLCVGMEDDNRESTDCDYEYELIKDI